MPRAGLTTARVVDEAQALTDEVGLANLTLAAVAARLGVRQPSLYKHIDDMAALQRLLTVRAIEEMADVFARAAAGRSGGDALTAIAHAWREWASAHPGRYASTVRAPAPGDDEHVRVAGDVLGIVGAALRAYDLVDEDAIHATRVFRATVHGFIALEQAGGFGLPVDVRRSFDIAIGDLTGSLDHWPTSVDAGTTGGRGRAPLSRRSPRQRRVSVATT
jgi:AcrR family transcriptional regulator